MEEEVTPPPNELHLVFFDQDNERGHALIEAYQIRISVVARPNTFFVNMDVDDLIRDYQIDVIVSPANCLGFMDGGIDMVYMSLFPGIQERVQSAIAKYNQETALGRKVLPIGSCELVPTGNVATPLLACVPTMFLPGNICGTQNVYHAMRGLLLCCERAVSKPGLVLKKNRLVVAIPCLGTGIGQLSGGESGDQIARAMRDHAAGLELVTDEMRARNVVLLETRAPSVVLSGMACAQPNNYANTEIQPDADPKELVKRI